MNADSSRLSSAGTPRMPCHIRATLACSSRHYAVRISEIGRNSLVLQLSTPLSFAEDAELQVRCAEFGRIDVRLASLAEKTMIVHVLHPNSSLAQIFGDVPPSAH